MPTFVSKYSNREDGFTLIELLIVVLIIGILAAIAIPVYLGIQNQSHKAVVRADTNIAVKKVQVALTEGATIASQYGTTNGTEKGETVQVKASTTTGANANDFMVTGNESTLNNPKGAVDYTYQYDSVTGQFSDSDSGAIALGGASQPKVTITSSSIPTANTTDAYTATITVVNTNPTSTNVFSITGLPTGYTYSTTSGTITAPAGSGTVGAYPITVTVTNGAASDTHSYTLTVNSKPTITTASLPNGTANTAYPTTNLTASGTPNTFTYALTSGTLPAGINLTTAGVISGTPTTSGTTTFAIAATNTTGTGPAKSFTITVSTTPTITTTSLPNGASGSAYNQTITATGYPSPTFSGATNAWVNCTGETGTCTLPDSSAYQVRYGINGNYNYQTITGGTTTCNNTVYGDPSPGYSKVCDYLSHTTTAGLPAGLTIDPNSGTITGTPTTTGGYGITITADNGTTPTSKTFTTVITSTPNITTTSLPNGTAGQAYSQVITTTGYPTPTFSNFSSLGWVTCAGENSTCTLPDSTSYQVRFGANGNYITKAVTGSIACSNTAFGSDPAPGVSKTCAYQTGSNPLALGLNTDGTITVTGTTSSMKSGTYTITLTAVNSTGSNTKVYTLTIN